MEEFLNVGMKIQNRTSDAIQVKAINLAQRYRQTFEDVIKDIIREEISVIPESKISDWIDEFFITPFLKKIQQKVEKSNDKLEDIMHNFTRHENIEYYRDDLSEIIKKENSDSLQEIVEEFKNILRDKIYYYVTSYIEIRESILDEKLFEIKANISKIVSRKIEDFFKEYQRIIATEFNKNINVVKTEVTEFKKEEILSLEELEKLAQHMYYYNYELYKEGDKIYTIDLSQGKKIILKPSKDDNNVISLSSEDNTLKFVLVLNNNQFMYVDKNKDKVTSVYENLIFISNTKGKYKTYIQKNNGEYIFSYGDIQKRITKIEKIAILIDIFKKSCPKHYEELLNDPAFKKYVDQAREREEQRNDFFIDKDGLEKIVPERKNKIQTMFRIFGYEIKEKEDGIYAINLDTQEEEKIKIVSGTYCVIKDKNGTNFNFQTDIDFVLEDSISIERVIFKNEKGSIYTDRNLERFTIYINNNIYGISLKDDNIKYIGKTRDGKKLPITEEEIKEIIRQQYPHLISYVNFEQTRRKMFNEGLKQENAQMHEASPKKR